MADRPRSSRWLHDVVVTAGVYSLVGFEVTPGTVIGLLTILGFSLYDTVVVFDKVRENTAGLLQLTRRTYGEAANLALNQTLMRSINTSLIAVLPVAGLLIVGVGILGVGTLADLALCRWSASSSAPCPRCCWPPRCWST
jgi:preprotein translocase subunit SecF